MKSNEYAKALIELLISSGSAEIAVPMSAYMRNQFDFYGLKSPERNQLLRNFIASHGLPQKENVVVQIKELWNADGREAQYCAMEILDRVQRKSKSFLPELGEWMILHKSWWDTVDFIAPKIMGNYFLTSTDSRNRFVSRWMKGENLWLKRSALIFQLNYKGDTDEEMLFTLINKLKTDEDFFIRKAIGWALRQYAKSQPGAVRKFVDKTDGLSPLSVKEALKLVGTIN